MFNTIFQHEIKHWLRQPLPYIFGIFLFALSFVSMWGMASERSGGAFAEVMNSYYRINFMANYLSMFILFILPAIIGVSIYRDYKSRMYQVLYSYPITKKDYLLAKFCSAFLVVSVVVGMIGLGFALGAMMPGISSDVILPFDFGAYLHLYGFFILPNLFLFGVIVLAIVIRTRNIYLAFISIILVIILQALLGSILTTTDLQYFAALFDPMGDKAVKYIVQYWTLEDRNQLALPMTGVLLWNRLLWSGIAVGIAFFTYREFEFQQFTNTSSSKKKQVKSSSPSLPISRVERIDLPLVRFDFSLVQQLKTAWQLSNIDFRYIAWSWPFIAILFAGFLMVYFQQEQMNPMYGYELLPTTANMLRMPMFFFSLVLNLLTFLYVGVLMYRGQITRMHALIDVVPQPNWVLLFSRLLAILKVQVLLLTLVMLGGILTQIFNGYSELEIGHYLFELFVLQLIHFAIWACMAMFVHSLFNNLYLGFFILLMMPLGFSVLPEIGKQLNISFLQESILQFNTVPGIKLGFEYSDFDGYGSILPVYFVYKLYWLIGAVMLLLLALFLWKRGLTFSIKERWQMIKNRFTGHWKWATLLVVIAFVGMGSTLFYQEHYVSKFSFTQEEMDQVLAINEKQYGHFHQTLQPKIAKANVQMDIYPSTQNFQLKGNLYFVNKVDEIIDTILVASSFKEQTNFNIQQPHQVLSHDTIVHFDVILLEQGLAKGDTLNMEIDIQNHPNATFHHNSRVLKNGTYMWSNILPRLGFRNIYLKSTKKRKKYGLGKRISPKHVPSDSTLLGYRFAENNMDQIEYDCILSTSEEQAAFSMGTLIKKWQDKGRNYYHFSSKGKIVNNISWLSGEYTKDEAQCQHQHLEFYHRPTHTHNMDYLKQGMCASLDYCSHWFGPLQHDTLKMVEFPLSQGTHATLNGNLIPYSESQLLCNINHSKNEVFNVPFYVSAHEIAHYWWGHRVDPANVQGGKLLTEAMADYLAIKVVEQEFGKERAMSIRKTFLDLYLRRRAGVSDEQPLVLARLNQDYINYRKGSYVLYALSELIGEEAFNRLLSKYEQAYRFAPPPYPTSLDFVDSIRTVVPDSLAYFINDNFETITLYDNTLKSVEPIQTSNGKQQIKVNFTMSKYRANAAGKKSYTDNAVDSLSYQNKFSLPLNDYIQIGFYDANDTLIHVKTVKTESIGNEIIITLDQAVSKVKLDPNYILIDGNQSDQEWVGL